MSLEIRLGDRRGDFALEVAFEAPIPGVTALFGPSGSGKSSIVHAVAGLYRPRAGRIAVAGETLIDTATGIFVPAHLRRCPCVFQEARLFPHLSVRENLLFGARRAKAPPSEKEMDALIGLLGLEAFLARRPKTLSGGERQRVALGRALLAQPRLLLLDEPLAALDAARRAEILPYLEDVARERRTPLLYVTHAIEEVARLADHIIVLKEGRIAAQGTVFDLLSRLEAGEALGPHGVGGVIAARLTAEDPRHGLTELAFSGGRLVVPYIARPLGIKVRVRIDARDITLALDPPGRISANNILAARITDLKRHASGVVDVQLACGEARLVARVTSLSAERLALAPGLSVTAIIKTVTVDGRR